MQEKIRFIVALRELAEKHGCKISVKLANQIADKISAESRRD